MKKLNFGCGIKILEGYVNVDIQKNGNIDYSFDFNKFPYPFKDNEFDFIFCDNTLEHLDNPLEVLNELNRILKKGKPLRIKVPYYNSHTAYNDIRHTYYFNRRSFENLIRPSYYQHYKEIWKLENVRFIPSPIGRFIPYLIIEYVSWMFGWIINQIEVDLIKL